MTRDDFDTEWGYEMWRLNAQQHSAWWMRTVDALEGRGALTTGPVGLGYLACWIQIECGGGPETAPSG